MHSPECVLVAIAQPLVRDALTCLLRDQGLTVLPVLPRDSDIEAALRHRTSLCVFLGWCDGDRLADLARRLASPQYPLHPAVVLVAPESCTVHRHGAAPMQLRDPSLAALLALLATPRT